MSFKKSLTSLALGILAFSLVACAPTSEQANNSASYPNTESKVVETDTKAKQTSNVEQNNDSGKLGDYEVTVKSARLSKDYENKPIIIVKYNFKNNSEEAECFGTEISAQAFQNGVELDSAIVGDDNKYNASDYLRDIKSGASLDVEIGYLLSDDKASVDIEATSVINPRNYKITKTFDMAKLK